MSGIVLLEGLGVAVSIAAVFFALRTHRVLTPDSRIALTTLMLTAFAIHAFDLAEWLGSESADWFGDVLKILMPAAWLFFLFVVTRERLVGQIGVQDQQLRFFFEQAPMAVAVLNSQGQYLQCSRRWCELHGKKEPPIGRRLDETAGERGEKWLEVSERCLTSEALLTGEDRFQSPEGEETWFEWVIRPWFVGGQVGGTILVVQDTTAEVRERELVDTTREQLLCSQQLQAIGEVATGAAHDINNLLAVISMHAELIHQAPHDENELLESLDSIRQAVGVASSMLQALMAFSRQHKPEFITIDLAKYVQDTCRMLQRTLTKRIVLCVFVPDTPCWIRADTSGLQQLLLNLTLNARDAMRGEGSLRISVTTTECHHQISVQDSGTGIPVELRERILEPFFTTKKDVGTGLGLAVVQRVTNTHNATLSIDSVLGKGSTFTISFPRLRDPEDINGDDHLELRSA